MIYITTRIETAGVIEAMRLIGTAIGVKPTTVYGWWTAFGNIPELEASRIRFPCHDPRADPNAEDKA